MLKSNALRAGVKTLYNKFSFQTQKSGQCTVFAIILLSGKDATVWHDTFGQARSHWAFVCSSLHVSFPNFVVPRNMF